MTDEQVEKIAQGHVLTGQVMHGKFDLADQLGGLM